MAKKTRKKISRKMVCIICGILVIIVVLTSLIFAFSKKETNEVLQATKTTANAVNLENNEHMHVEEDASEDKVPVPNGYVGSSATGENEIDTGYVIYEGEEAVTDSNVADAQKSRNQYVWIPVPDISKFYGTDANGKKWGKIYQFTTGTNSSELFDEVTGTYPYNWTEENGIMTIKDESDSIEPSAATWEYNDSALKRYDLGIKNAHDFLMEVEKEFNNMIASVEKYGGFYIGRYETGDLKGDIPVVQKGNTDINYQTWYEMYDKCKKLKMQNINIETGIIWGNQWDRTLMWLIETGDKTIEQICEDSTTWSSKKIISTGSAEYTKANNIYDLAGHVEDWTMEESSGWRVTRGENEASDRLLYIGAGPDYSYDRATRRLSCITLY